MVNQYNVVREWEAWERDGDLCLRPITVVTQGPLRNVGLLKSYEEATSLKGNSRLVVQLIRQWDVHQQDFCVGLYIWYQPAKEEFYFITSLSKRGYDFPQFPYVPLSVSIDSQLIYSQRYVGDHLVSLVYFQVSHGMLRIFYFGAQEVRFLSLLVTTIAHTTNDGKRISCPLFFMLILWCRSHDVSDGLQFLWYICIDLDRCRYMIHGRLNFPFASQLLCFSFKRFPEISRTFHHHHPRSTNEI